MENVTCCKSMIPQVVLKQEGWVVKTCMTKSNVVSGTNRGNVLVCGLGNYENTWTINLNDEISDICASSNCFLIGSLGEKLIICNWDGKKQNYYDIEGACKIVEHKDSFLVGTRNGQLHWLDKELSIRKSLAVDPIWELKAYGKQIFVASTRGSVSLIDWNTGDILSRKEYDTPVYGIELVDNLICVGTAEGMIEILRPDFISLYCLKTPAVRIITSCSDGILVCFVDGSLVLFDFDLNKKWAFKTKSWIKAVKTTDCIIVIGSADYCIYVLNYEGTLLGQYRTGYSVLSVDVNSEIMVAGSADGGTYIFTMQTALCINGNNLFNKQMEEM